MIVTSKNPQHNYDPLSDPLYMSPQMLFYFQDKLEAMRQIIMAKEKAISTSLIDNPNREPDPVDRGTREELLYNDFMFQEHEDHVLKEIENALDRIDKGTYGYCELTKEPIGVQRLIANPAARFCVEAQKARENL